MTDAGGVDLDPWSLVASEWAVRWGGFARPAQQALLTASVTGPGVRVLDVGCGSGEFLALAHGDGLVVTGVDPAAGMVETSRRTAPGARVELADAEALPFEDDSFDVVVATNVLQFVVDVDAALSESTRVLVPGGRLGIATWAEGVHNDLDAVESAVSAHHGEEPRQDRDLSRAGDLEDLLHRAGLAVVGSGLVQLGWEAADDDALVRGVLLGEDEDGLAAVGPVVVTAARPFRRPDGSYLLVNAFRWVVGVRR